MTRFLVLDETSEDGESAKEGEPSEIRNVGGEDGSNDGTNLDTSLVLLTVVEVIADLLDEVGEVEVADTSREGVHEVGNSATGVGSDLVGDLSPVGDDNVETTVLKAVGNRNDSHSVH